MSQMVHHNNFRYTKIYNYEQLNNNKLLILFINNGKMILNQIETVCIVDTTPHP